MSLTFRGIFSDRNAEFAMVWLPVLLASDKTDFRYTEAAAIGTYLNKYMNCDMSQYFAYL